MHADPFETLAEPARRRIVELLRDGELSVNDVVAQLDLHQSGVSRHLQKLQEAGFVTVRPEGPRRFYALAPEPFEELDAWLQGYRELWESRLDRLGKVLEEKAKARTQRHKKESSR